MNETQIDESIKVYTCLVPRVSRSGLIPPCLPVYHISAVRCISGFFYSHHNWYSWILQIFIMHSKKLLRTHQRFIFNTPKYYVLCHSICRNSVCCYMQRGDTTNYKSLYLLPILYLWVQAHIFYCFVRCAHKISYITMCSIEK